MTDDVLALSLVPTNLQLGADSEDIDGIADTIQERASQAPEGVGGSYAGALEAVEDFARAKEKEENGGPEAAFDETRYDAAVEAIRDWLTGTCS
ncbi:hypothetical protein [Arthrobacter zhaoguopingii]|uniref:hypothetical protein n=1 Tax=Arthrobacter zhaoguopingii TaxID=2681491 RepID=UPI00135B7A7F|nr:hypothetical protein [Arthrobacter zhaoguopingii]